MKQTSNIMRHLGKINDLKYNKFINIKESNTYYY